MFNKTPQRNTKRYKENIPKFYIIFIFQKMVFNENLQKKVQKRIIVNILKNFLFEQNLR